MLVDLDHMALFFRRIAVKRSSPLFVNKSSDVNREMQGHFWRLGEETPGDRFAPPTAVPGILTISEDGLAKLS